MADDVAQEAIELEEMSGARPSTDASIVIQLLAGLLGTIIIAFAVFPLRTMQPSVAYVYQIINERGPVQYFELFMAFMVLALVILKSRIVKSQLTLVADVPVDLDVDLSDDDEIAEIRREVRSHDAYTWSILLNRIDRMLALWLGTKDVGRVARWASSESERDMSSSDSSYAIARVLIWAIPILGFIGTVVGLGGAVSGFSDFLAGGAGLAEIQEAIGDVTQGLGMAFDTTLLALILSVILMFPLSVIQRREENLFVEIDNYLDDMLLSRFPEQEDRPIRIENLEDVIESSFRRYIPDPDRYEEVFTNAINRASGTVEERFGSLAKSYEGALNGLTARISSSLATVGDSLEHSMRKIAEEMREEQNAFLERRQSIAAEELEQAKAIGAEVRSSTEGVAQQYAESAAALQKATEESAQTTVGAANQISERMAEVTKLAAGIQDLLKVQETVERSLSEINASAELRQTLDAIRSHLEATDAVYQRLNKPRVITLREEVG